jgi:hypothetical protein
VTGKVLAAAVLIASGAMPAARAQADCGSISGYGSGTVYYISPSGSATNTGTSCDSPWPMDKASVVRQAGDTVAFQGGATFTRSLSLQSENGTSSEPIFYTSYGTGPANLTGGVWLQSVSYLEFTGLDISSSTTPGVHSSGSGTGARYIMLVGDTITSSYDDAIGGYGVSAVNSLDTNWTIDNNTIANTADSGVFDHAGGPAEIDGNTFTNNGIGTHCGPPSTPGVNPCHAIYGKGPNITVIGNRITSPQTAGVSLRYQNNDIENNVITGGQKGVAFSSETTTPGISYVKKNTITGQSDTALIMYPGTQPEYESLDAEGNTLSASDYDLFLKSGPNSGTTQTVTLAGNKFAAGAGILGYVNLASPVGFTAQTYTEQNDTFCGLASTGLWWYISDSARSFSTYTKWFGLHTEGTGDTVTSTC